MRLLLVICIIGIAGVAFAMPGVIRERMSREFRNKKGVGGFKRPMNPLHMVRTQLSKSMTSASHRKKMDCELCPPASDMEPCSCECVCNGTKCLANIICISNLVTSSELQRVLSLPSYPVRDYSKLLVEKTVLDGGIDDLLLGSTITFREIDFNHNGFTYVDKNAFKNSRSTLNKLILNTNEISTMADWTLADIPNIQYIDISNNKIRFIPADEMHSEHLSFLNVSHNYLMDGGHSAFRSLPRLSHLDLSHNSLKELKEYFLEFHLHEDIPLLINLTYNEIASVKSNAISGVKNLTMDLRYNKMQTLKEEVFRNFIDSTNASIHIDVTGNPITCGCPLLWVVQNSTVANCFDDFPVCDITIKYVTIDMLGDCGQNKTITTY